MKPFGTVLAVFTWIVALGLSIGYVVVAIATGTNLGDSSSALVGVTFSSVGVLIATKQRGNRVGWIFLGIGVFLALNGFAFAYADYLRTTGNRSLWHWWAWIGTWSWQPGFFLLMPTLLLVFPDGRIAWRTGRKLLIVCSVAMVGSLVGTIWNPSDLPEVAGYRNPIGLEGWLDPLDYALAIGAVVWLPLGMFASARGLYLRFRSAAGPQRQQLKLFVWAGFGTLATYIAGSAFFNSLDLVAGGVVALLGVPLLPVATGVAILKHRLFDIDLIVNRTLVYGMLTAVLAGTYFGVVVLLQRLAEPITRDSDLAVAASTLIVAALFSPARSGVQTFIDHRFFRRKYDATRTLEEFSSRLRNEVELSSLTHELVSVVGSTMQPSHASVWLRSAESR